MKPGEVAEALAADFLARQGLRVLVRNWRCRGGEIDLVAQDGATLVFAEVRLRRNSRFGGAAASIDARKRARIVLAARLLLASRPAWAGRPCRFDAILLDGLDADRIEWVKHAFDAG